MPVRPSSPKPHVVSRAVNEHRTRTRSAAPNALSSRAAPPRPDEPSAMLGGLTPTQFMRRYWQKKPLLIRQAFSGMRPPVSKDDLFELAMRDDVESRLIEHQASRGDKGWRLEPGPLERLPSGRQRAWTLLVQGVNLHDNATEALMNRFRFIPDARLDDVMISYATDGGGVGPHFDSYDVFLLQIEGKRRWRIGAQRDLTLKPGVPLKILQHFEPTDEWLLEPGDMLYLPPHIAHDGVAQGECMTCSIGFRAPLDGELLGQFFYHAAERASRQPGAERRYADPGQLAAGAHPAALPSALVAHVTTLLKRVRWSSDDVAEFIGSYLSEPKANVFFEPPSRPMSQNGFVSRITEHGIELDRKTILLYDNARYYINGESEPMTRGLQKWIVPLADERTMAGKKFVTLSHHSPMTRRLYEWYRAGWVRLGNGSKGGPRASRDVKFCL
jgi:50S ribosomal protein L16 3-hydroxylase